MEAPKKIYVSIGARQSLIARAGQTLKSDIEYIRKDALLEWVKKEMKEWSSESTTSQGVKMGLTLVIDKIESL